VAGAGIGTGLRGRLTTTATHAMTPNLQSKRLAACQETRPFWLRLCIGVYPAVGSGMRGCPRGSCAPACRRCPLMAWGRSTHRERGQGGAAGGQGRLSVRLHHLHGAHGRGRLGRLGLHGGGLEGHAGRQRGSASGGHGCVGWVGWRSANSTAPLLVRLPPRSLRNKRARVGTHGKGLSAKSTSAS
jgi:hypothetical protein